MLINPEGVVQATKEEFQSMLKQQSDITMNEIVNFCADLCDIHRGHLQVGEMIRQHFGIVKGVQHSEEPVKEEVKKSHLKRIK
jgi:hypothetical protein